MTRSTVHRRTGPRGAAGRRRPLTLIVAIAFAAAALGPGAGPTQALSGSLTLVAGGFAKPLFVAEPPDGSGRLFVVEQGGRIRIVKNGSVLGTPFLDISWAVSTASEQGLLGLAFHPKFATNRKFYVNFTRANGDTAINEYRASSSNADVADMSTRRRIITIAQPYANHNGGHMTFGRDGYLYIATGDGGSAGDPGNRAQRVDTLLGKILRIDINGTLGSRQYRIPKSNPWVGKTGRNEIWSRGLRNPWRFSFDRSTGDLWIGDVGQSRYEEIDRSSASVGAGKGKNFGWRVLEGNACYRPSSGCDRSGKVSPVVVYGRTDGCSVTGGYVYRGSASPALVGRYVFGDYCSGKIWTIANRAKRPATKQLLIDTNLNISSFGEDAAGELYVVDLKGGVYRLTASS
jgi:glucose/arabinose dehydrogenase